MALWLAILTVVLVGGVAVFTLRARQRATRELWLKGPPDAETLGMAAWHECGPHKDPTESALFLRDCLWVAGFERSDAVGMADGHLTVANALVAGNNSDVAAGMAAVYKMSGMALAKWVGHPRVQQVREGVALALRLEMVRSLGGD